LFQAFKGALRGGGVRSLLLVGAEGLDVGRLAHDVLDVIAAAGVVVMMVVVVVVVI